ncbi:Hypothetical protein FKW44_004065 [Caligus rogercresseyi]|uniref:Uncharacterized protein n=1 Tax=Caligus rogercresseyi TaxID=217165 RepID=A0A7T8HLC6_CALRO|nr:Hypothetical protein FKW44_004065 [Caligus rogercresseyi]
MEFFQSFSILSFNEALNDLEDPIDSAYCGIPRKTSETFKRASQTFFKAKGSPTVPQDAIRRTMPKSGQSRKCMNLTGI